MPVWSIGQEPIFCIRSMRQLSVQVHPLDMTLVCRRALPPIQPLLLSVKQGGIGYHFYSLWYDSARAQTCNLPISGPMLNSKATELVLLNNMTRLGWAGFCLDSGAEG